MKPLTLRQTVLAKKDYSDNFWRRAWLFRQLGTEKTPDDLWRVLATTMGAAAVMVAAWYLSLPEEERSRQLPEMQTDKLSDRMSFLDTFKHGNTSAKIKSSE